MPLPPYDTSVSPPPTARRSFLPEASRLWHEQEDLPLRVLTRAPTMRGESWGAQRWEDGHAPGDAPVQPKPSYAVPISNGDIGDAGQPRTAALGAQGGLEIGRAVGEAVKPLAVQVEDNGVAVRQMAQVLGQLGRRLEERLKEERLHLDNRFEEHEELMTKRADGRLSQLTKNLQQWQRQAAVDVSWNRKSTFSLDDDLPTARPQATVVGSPPRSALDETWMTMEASLKRIEASLSARNGGDEQPQSEAPGCAGGFGGAACALKGCWEVDLEGSTSSDLAVAHACLRSQDLASQPVCCEDICVEEPRLQPKTPPEKRLQEPRATTPSVGQGNSLKVSKRHGVDSDPCGIKPGRGTGSESCASLFTKIQYTLTHKTSKASVMHKASMMGLGYEDILHYQTTAKGCFHKKLSNFLLSFYLFWTQLEEPERRGRLARFVKSYFFESLCAVVICANAGFLAYTANQRAELLEDISVSISGEVFFLVWYIIEVSMKMAVHRIYYFVGPEMNWNLFDLMLVVLAVIDFVGTVVLSTSRSFFSDATLLRSLRVLKMAKILRVMRIMRVFNDLRLMLTSVIGSCVSLMWSFLMLAFVYYIFGLIFVQSMTDFLIEEGSSVDPTLRADVLLHFGSLSQAMLTLFKATNGGNDWDYYYLVLAPTGWLNCAMFIFFIGFIQISLMNILTALFVERAMRLAQPDTISQAREQRIKERSEAEELRRMCMDMDANHSGTVSADEFRKHIESDEMRCYFSVLGLDIRNAQEFFEMLIFISDDDEVDIESFVQGCLRMRGAASGIAQQNLIMETRLLRRAQLDLFQQFSKKLDALSERLPS